MPLPEGTGSLHAVTTADGFGYLVGGTTVHDGDALEVLEPDGTWSRGRLRWSGRRDDWPALVMDGPGSPAHRAGASAVLDEGAEPVDVLYIQNTAVLRVVGDPAAAAG